MKKQKRETEKPKVAAAIRYDAARDDAPRLTAKGQGHVAERIIELARQHDIPVRSDKALVQILSQLDIDRHIPPDLYKAVAEILAFVYSANEKYREQPGSRVKGQRYKGKDRNQAEKQPAGNIFPNDPNLPARTGRTADPLFRRLAVCRKCSHPQWRIIFNIFSCLYHFLVPAPVPAPFPSRLWHSRCLHMGQHPLRRGNDYP